MGTRKDEGDFNQNKRNGIQSLRSYIYIKENYFLPTFGWKTFDNIHMISRQ